MEYPFSGEYEITQDFGEKLTNPAGHKGIDYGLPLGTPVLAAAFGTVKKISQSQKGYGNQVLISHTNRLQSRYAHLSSLSVHEGETVVKGEPLGMSGSSGNSTGPHLHFEVILDGVPVDPRPYLEAKPEINSDHQWRVIVDQLYVRSGPGIEYPIVSSLQRGDLIDDLEHAETLWLNIGRHLWTAATYKGNHFCEKLS